MINKTFHLIWLGDKEPQLPYKEKLGQMYPNFTIKIWRDKDFDFENSNSFAKKALEMKKWSFVTDYFRMKILFEEGGVYLDTDMDPTDIFPFDKYEDKDLILGYEYRNNITMGFIAANKGNIFVKEVMDYYDSIMDCNFFPLGNLVWTEMLYKLYPDLGVANKTKDRDELLVLDRNAFGLWEENKHKSYFIHRHDIGWIDNKFIQWMIHTSAKFAKFTPAWVENVMVSWNRKQTSKRSKQLLNKEIEYIEVKKGTLYLDKVLFEKINSNMNRKVIILNNKNKYLARDLFMLDKVIKVKQTGKDISENVEKDKTIELSQIKFRSKLETDNNLLNKKHII